MSSPDRLRIVGASVYDPMNGIQGDVRDICIEDGRIVAEVPLGTPTLNARGMIVMPGGVDIHSHVASSACNHARRLLPEEHTAEPVRAPELLDGEAPARSGTGGTLPSTFTTGYRYAGLGYTTVFDAAVAPIMARHSHEEFDDTPIVDGGFFVLLGNDEYLLRQVETGNRDRARDYAAWMLGATGGYAIKIVNPGRHPGLEVRPAQPDGDRSASGVQPGDPPGDSGNPDRRGQQPQAAAPGAYPLQQSGHAGERRHHAAQHGGARRPARPLHPPAVPLLRDRRRRRLELRRPAGHRVPECQSSAERRRGPGHVWPGNDHQRRRPGRVPAACQQRAQVDQYRCRAGDWVRDRPLLVPGAGCGFGAAVGGGPRALPPQHRPLARGPLHRFTRTADRSCLIQP